MKSDGHLIKQCQILSTVIDSPFMDNGILWKKGRWRGAVRDLKDGMEEYEMIKGYHVTSEKIEK